MKRSAIGGAALLLLPFQATLAVTALSLVLFAAEVHAQEDVFRDGIAKARRLSDLQRWRELRAQSDGDTTYVGFNPAYAGPNNPWQIGVGAYRPHAGSNNARRGYWDWDTPINGDSLQGFWPMRHLYSSGTSMPPDDKLRPWYALEHGNVVNYVINQGLKRTFGVVGVWHADPGGITSTMPGTNPSTPNLVVSGTRAAWCGLRGHGDRTAIDGVTGNPITAEAIPITMEQGVGTSAGGTSRRLPGYIGAWDQFLYRDLDVSARGDNPLRVRFKLRTRMSTNFVTTATTRTGWNQFDPTSPFSPNFISSTDAGANAPRDSFMVYVGKPVEPVVGTNNDFVNAAGLSRDLYDPLRRWFSEIVRIDGTSTTGRFSQIYGCAGDVNDGVALPNDGFATIDCGIGDAQLDGIGNTARLVFRNKTNRAALAAAGNSDDETGSYNGTYNSGYGGAAIVDDVQISLDHGGSYVTVGDFESSSGAGNNIDNLAPATVAWRSTGKPPALHPHVRDVSDIAYIDLCGPPGSENRHCNMIGTVLSMGEYPNENTSGNPGTIDAERWDSILSPTICLATAGPNIPNHMGITGDMANATEDYYVIYDWAIGPGGLVDATYLQEGWQAYPAQQQDGSVCWSDFQRPGFASDPPSNGCFTLISDPAQAVNLIYTTNASGIPDSIRFVLRKLTYCYRFTASSCGNASANYPFAFDNVTFVMIDGAAATPLSTNFWQWLQDAFPANENPALPGTAAFDTCAAWPQIGLNISNRTTTLLRHDVAGDTTMINVSGVNVRLDLVFRVLPGPGNYVLAGTTASGLRRRPASATAITSSDSSFWTSYLNDNGAYGTPGGHPAGAHASRWSPLVWNSARCDTVDLITAPVTARGWGLAAVGGGFYCSMLHEDELSGARAKLAILRNQCYLKDTLGVLQAPNITCGRAIEGGVYPPAWVNAVPHSRTGYPVSNLTSEGTKIFPDGVFTPGTHVQYFFRRQNLDMPSVFEMLPDTNFVLQWNAGRDFDGKRWQTWAVLPDAWKKPAYGGLGEACMLFVDWNDGRGEELYWVSAADSIGATSSAKWGAHNGWHAPGLGVDIEDPAGFVRDKNAQPGTTWDMYGVKAGEAGADGSGSIGSRESNREPVGLEAGKDARNAPTQTMLDQYGMVFIASGTLLNDVLGPFNNRSQNDKKVLKTYLLNGNAADVRVLLVMGEGFLESIDPGAGLESEVQKLLAADLVDDSFRDVASQPLAECPDLTPSAPITSNGDVYGFNNSCFATLDVLSAASGGQVVVRYPDNLGAGVLHPVNPGNGEYWLSLATGFKLQDLRSRFCGSSMGRLSFLYDVLNLFESVIGPTCSLTGDPSVTLDVPHGSDGRAFVDFMGLKNNPLVQGNAIVRFGLAKSDRVTLKIYDVTGRLVRTLLDHQSFQAGNWDVTWDGADDGGRQVPRGVYFSALQTGARKSFQKKLTVLK